MLLHIWCRLAAAPGADLLVFAIDAMMLQIIAEIARKGSSTCAASGALYALLCFTGLACLYSCAYRSTMRAQYDLEDTPCGDCLVHFFCEGCSLCQGYRELKNHGFNMGIGWEANVDRRRRGITQPPVVAQGMTR